jgi:FAD/FMN-containing dehydrogenase
MDATKPAITTETRQSVSITNFGGNISFVARRWYAPRNEEEVLELLNRHTDGKVRVLGSLHSWSDVAVSEDVLVDLRHFNQVEITRDGNGEVWAKVGAGCNLRRLLDIIHQETDATLPTMGGIKKQTISGAISTGTHGSGKPSLSHYMEEIRVAAYDPGTGQARIYDWKSGPELQAARCALGCMGIILSVKFRCVPKYYVAEAIVRRDTLAQILAEEEESPLQQFILIPYCWKYYVYQRWIADSRPTGWETWRAYQKRAYSFLGVDVLLHLLLKAIIMGSSSEQGSSKTIQWFYRTFLPRFIERKRSVLDFSENAITLHHDIFQHLEMEAFVPRRNIHHAVNLIHHITSVFAGLAEDVPEGAADELQRIGKLETLASYKGSYTHHYPIYFRRILPDDTLISMTSSSSEAYYSISFFTYLKPESRQRFYELADFVARCLTQLYDARLHWGKYFPLTNEEVEGQFPNLPEFRQICDKVDPNGVFRNAYAERVLGFGRPGLSS